MIQIEKVICSQLQDQNSLIDGSDSRDQNSYEHLSILNGSDQILPVAQENQKAQKKYNYNNYKQQQEASLRNASKLKEKKGQQGKIIIPQQPNDKAKKDRRNKDRLQHLSKLLPQERVWMGYLDVGCGNAEISAAIAQHLGITNVYGIDVFSQDNFNQPSTGLQIKYIQNNQNKIEIPSKSVDLVTAFMALHHFEFLDQMLREIQRVLLVGGYLFIREHDVPCNNRKLATYIEDMHRKYPDHPVDGYIKLFDRHSLREILSSYGFQHLADSDYNKANPQAVYHSLYILNTNQINLNNHTNSILNHNPINKESSSLKPIDHYNVYTSLNDFTNKNYYNQLKAQQQDEEIIQQEDEERIQYEDEERIQQEDEERMDLNNDLINDNQEGKMRKQKEKEFVYSIQVEEEEYYHYINNIEYNENSIMNRIDNDNASVNKIERTREQGEVTMDEQARINSIPHINQNIVQDKTKQKKTQQNSSVSNQIAIEMKQESILPQLQKSVVDKDSYVSVQQLSKQQKQNNNQNVKYNLNSLQDINQVRNRSKEIIVKKEQSNSFIAKDNNIHDNRNQVANHNLQDDDDDLAHTPHLSIQQSRNFISAKLAKKIVKLKSKYSKYLPPKLLHNTSKFIQFSYQLKHILKQLQKL